MSLKRNKGSWLSKEVQSPVLYFLRNTDKTNTIRLQFKTLSHGEWLFSFPRIFAKFYPFAGRKTDDVSVIASRRRWRRARAWRDLSGETGMIVLFWHRSFALHYGIITRLHRWERSISRGRALGAFRSP